MRGCNDYCKNQQPRFNVHSEPMAVIIDQLFIPFKQCLPGCKATENILNVTTQFKNGFYKHLKIIKHTSCNPWSPSTQSQTDSNLLAVLNTSKSQGLNKCQRGSDEGMNLYDILVRTNYAMLCSSLKKYTSCKHLHSCFIILFIISFLLKFLHRYQTHFVK